MKKIVNRKFSREYESIEQFEAGIVLTGAEVKSIREGAMRLDDAFVRIIQGQPILLNADIYPYKYADNKDYEPKRSRKLLLSKKEITRILTKIKGSGRLTLAPVSCYNKGSLIKLEIALVRGRRDIEKRKLDKKKKIERREKRETKEYINK